MTVRKLTQRFVNSLKANNKRYEIRDAEIKGLFIRVEKSGRKTYYMNYRTPKPDCRQRNIKLCPGCLDTETVREYARQFLHNLWLEKTDPAFYRENTMTIKEILNKYKSYCKSKNKGFKDILLTLNEFKEFMNMPISSITDDVITMYINSHKDKIKNATINKRLMCLSGLITFAIEQKYIKERPFKFKALKQKDSRIVERYLSNEERDILLSEASKSKEEWLKSAIEISLNTGIRKGTLLKLRWEYINFENKEMSIPAECMKAKKAVLLPLNDVAIRVFEDYKKYCRKKFNKRCDCGYIFVNNKGEKLKDVYHSFVRLLKKCNIKNFTWHCMRHDFASQLAIKGVSLYIIQNLLCHSTSRMTQRYAHLNNSSLQNAVNILNDVNEVNDNCSISLY